MNEYLKHFLIIGAFFLWTASYVQAQNIQNLAFKIEGAEIRATYDLIGEVSERYTITLFSSANDFTTPLKYVIGDVGEDVIPGTNKTILWDARREFAEYKGSINLKIKYKIQPNQKFAEIEANSKFKKGKTVTIKWYEGPKSLTTTLDLYRNNELIQEVTLDKSGIIWTWDVPKEIKPGKGYKFKTMINGKPAYSAEFKISRKIPIPLIITVAAAGGVVVVAIISMTTKDDEIIALPPEPN